MFDHWGELCCNRQQCNDADVFTQSQTFQWIYESSHFLIHQLNSCFSFVSKNKPPVVWHCHNCLPKSCGTMEQNSLFEALKLTEQKVFKNQRKTDVVECFSHKVNPLYENHLLSYIRAFKLDGCAALFQKKSKYLMNNIFRNSTIQ